MNAFTLYILTAIALVFVLEGLIYALFPDAVKKMMAMAINMPTDKLRSFGALMVCTGLFLVWLFSGFHAPQ